MKPEKEIKLSEAGKEQFQYDNVYWKEGPFFYVKPHKTNEFLIMVRDNRGKVTSFHRDFFIL